LVESFSVVNVDTQNHEWFRADVLNRISIWILLKQDAEAYVVIHYSMNISNEKVSIMHMK
jgi:hypothetical protein